MNETFDGRRVVKEYEFHKPLLSEINSIIDNCKRDCYYNNYHKHKMTLEYHGSFTNERINEMFDLTISKIAVGQCELNERLKIARRNAFRFIQISKLTIKFSAKQSQMTLSYYFKHRFPIIHSQFFRKIAQNKKYIENFL